MKRIKLLDCTLRDGGYINEWNFGKKAIPDIIQKLGQAKIDLIEIGFLKKIDYKESYPLFSSNSQMTAVIKEKNPGTDYVGMIDVNDALPIEMLGERVPDSIDAIRVIFKKDKIEEGFDYCKKVQELGYKLFVQPVDVTAYSDVEFVELINKFNIINPYAFYIVDTLGCLKRKNFLRLLYLADNNLSESITLGYHSHNNLQQALGNAEAMAEMNTKRNIILDACVFGMGRGAGNLNLELFAEYMNENFDTNYKIEPLLEIIDLYLNDIYINNFWGYSLPFYLSASNYCHPNYANYFAEKGTLTEKAFNEILHQIPVAQKPIYSKSVAEKLYIEYQQNYIDDSSVIEGLKKFFCNKKVLLIGPGSNLTNSLLEIQKKSENPDVITIAINFISTDVKADFIFCSHMRRYNQIIDSNINHIPTIITSNLKEAKNYSYMINFSSYTSHYSDIVDNSGIMCLNFLYSLGVKNIEIAGLDGYSLNSKSNYISAGLEYCFSKNDIINRNKYIKDEINKLSKEMSVSFLTPSLYSVEDK